MTMGMGIINVAGLQRERFRVARDKIMLTIIETGVFDGYTTCPWSLLPEMLSEFRAAGYETKCDETQARTTDWYLVCVSEPGKSVPTTTTIPSSASFISVMGGTAPPSGARQTGSGVISRLWCCQRCGKHQQVSGICTATQGCGGFAV